MTDLRNETKEQLLERLKCIHALIEPAAGASFEDNRNIRLAVELACGETDDEYIARMLPPPEE